VSDKRGRGWPLSIIVIFIFLSTMLFGILYISIQYAPVNKENTYQMGYQEVDKNFNEIFEAQKLFDANYKVAFTLPKLSAKPVETMRANGEKVYFDHCFALEGENRLNLSVRDLSGDAVTDANISLLLTRFETSKFDIEVPVTAAENGTYISEPFVIDREGRWKAVVKVSVGDKTGYFEYCVYAR